MSIFEDFIGIFAPHRCISCGKEGNLICSLCSNKLESVVSRCYRCRKITDNFKTCKRCRSTSDLYRVFVRTNYVKEAKELVWKLKYAGAQSGAKDLAKLIYDSASIQGSLIIPIPTATSRVRQRGYDQAKLIAKHISKLSGFPYIDCLARSGQTHQIGSNRYLRQRQLKTAYRVKSNTDLKGASVMLIDDVVTTGSTLEAAAKCLKSAGVNRVEAIVFAQA